MNFVFEGLSANPTTLLNKALYYRSLYNPEMHWDPLDSAKISDHYVTVTLCDYFRVPSFPFDSSVFTEYATIYPESTTRVSLFGMVN